jgi:hypothetical protein
MKEGLIVMNGAVFTVLISGALSVLAALGTVALTHYFGRMRDREADWRKMKLEHYKEYVAALSGTVHHGYDGAVQRRYSDAANALALVAPTKVLTALYALLDETSVRNQNPTLARYESLLSSLLRSMREDCHPKPPKDGSEFTFRTINVPPEKKGNNKEQSFCTEK